jgi:hypothetical protein
VEFWIKSPSGQDSVENDNFTPAGFWVPMGRSRVVLGFGVEIMKRKCLRK